MFAITSAAAAILLLLLRLLLPLAGPVALSIYHTGIRVSIDLCSRHLHNAQTSIDNRVWVVHGSWGQTVSSFYLALGIH